MVADKNDPTQDRVGRKPAAPRGNFGHPGFANVPANPCLTTSYYHRIISLRSLSREDAMSPSNPWYAELFRHLRPYFDFISQKTTNDQVRYLHSKLRLKPGMSFLDCPCGIGRISIPMAKAGINVTGVDLNQEYLDELTVKAARAKLNIPTIRSDMRRIDFKSKFDAAGNLWTSFGYFEEDRENLLVLKKLYTALKPGGRFCLHVINRDWILSHYTNTDWQERGGVLFTESRTFDYAKSINRGVWTVREPGKTTRHEIGIRMYSYHELIAMFQRVGFVDIDGFGSTKDEPISRNTMMMWVFGTKPKR
jgi:2-polyprenyl-3-methyl-5-hydroxy-6-metoxy-1,4-benzoquinol methylase